MTTTRRDVALDWVEQWRASCAGKPAPLLKDLDAPHGRVRIHGRRGDRHGYAATFVRDADSAVVPLGSGDYLKCTDACLGALSGEAGVWDSARIPPPTVIARGVRRFFTPVDGRTVVGAAEIFGGVVLLGVHHGTWSFLFHDGRRTEWLGPKSRIFDLDAWLRDHPAPAVPASPVFAPAVPTPPTPPSAPSAPASSPPAPAAPATVTSPAAPASPATSASTPWPTTSPPPAASAVATPPGAPSPPPLAPTERRRQARAAQKDGEQQRQVAQKDAELRDQQHPVVVGPEDLDDGPSDSDRVRGCLRRLPDRAPAGQPQLVVDWFATMMIAVGEMGYFGNLYGRKANIAATLSRILGTPVCPRMLGLALTILHGMKCCLVDLAEKKKWWTVKLSGLGDPTSPLHQAFLAETGTGFQLPPEKVSFPGGRPVRPETPGKWASGEVTPPGTSTTADTLAQPSHAPAREGAEPDPSPTVGPRDAAPATDPAARVGEADLRHRLTVAQGLVKLARQRHEEDRVVWHRARAELERRVAAAEKREQATVAELALLRRQHDALLAKVTAIEQTAERTIAALVDKLERATSALEAAAEHQEVERQQRAAEADRHASEVARLTRHAEELRQRDHDVAAGRDQHAAEAERLGRVADEQRRREHDLIAGRDRDVGQQVDLSAAAEGVVRRTEECDLPVPWIADQHRPAAAAGDIGPSLSNVSSIVVACVGWTVATLTFTAARRVSTRSSPTHGAAALTSGMGDSGGCGLRQTPARFPWGGPAPSTGDLAAQGPRGPPVRRG